MAKGKSFFGLKRGSTKSLTFQVLNGTQIVKDRVFEVKNPRTTSQMVQRMVMATASAAYSAMKVIADHSFEGVTYGQMSMAEFIKRNAKLLRENLNAVTSKFAYNEYQNRGLVPGLYIIAKGSLNAPSVTPSLSSGDGTITLAISGATAQGAAPTANELAAYLGLEIGEMLTICMIYGNGQANGWNFSFARIKFDAEGTTVLTAANFADHFTVESDLGAGTLTIAATGFSIQYNADIADTSAIQRALIYSRQSANGWLRSTAKFNDPAGIVYAPTAATALATYPTGADYVLNGGNV